MVLNKLAFNAFLFCHSGFGVMVVSFLSGMDGKRIPQQVSFQFDSLSHCVCDVPGKEKPSIESAVMDKTLYAVASEGTSLDSQVSDQAARAPCYQIFDASGDLLETIANPVSDVSRGAAPQAVELLAARGVTLLFAARFGKKMIRELAVAGIRHKESRGEVGHVMRVFPDRRE